MVNIRLKGRCPFFAWLTSFSHILVRIFLLFTFLLWHSWSSTYFCSTQLSFSQFSPGITQPQPKSLLKGKALFLFFTFDTHRFQIGHFCFNLLLTGIVQPHSVLTWHCFVWTQFCCTLLSLTQFWLSLVEPRLSSAAHKYFSLTQFWLDLSQSRLGLATHIQIKNQI